MQSISLFTTRCTSQNNNLDGGSGCCSHELSGALTDVLDPHMLSNDYGIVNDIMVHVYIHFCVHSSLLESCSLSLQISPTQTSTNSLPQIFFISSLKACSRTTSSHGSMNIWSLSMESNVQVKSLLTLITGRWLQPMVTPDSLRHG